MLPSQYASQDLESLKQIPSGLPVKIDSRSLQAGDLFWTLSGEQVDSQKFLHDALEKGAAAAVVDASFAGEDYGLPLFRVHDRLAALQALAALQWQNRSQQVVAITGSVGKTTVKDFTATLLAEKFRVFSTPGNANSQIGLPLSLLNAPRDVDVLVLEMGMSLAGEIRRLVDIIPPDIAVITAVELAHAGFFRSLEEIAQAKGEILSHPRTRLGLVPPSFPHSLRSPVSRSFANWDETYRRPFQALHLVHNAAIALEVAQELQVPASFIARGLSKLSLPERRGQIVEREGVIFVNDSYNACAASMKAALDSLPHGNRRVAVLGEMKELGPFSEACHREVGECALACVDRLFCLGEGAMPLAKVWWDQGREAPVFPSRASLVERLRRELQVGDVVLLKGACSWGLWNILDEWSEVKGGIVAH